MSKLSNIHKLYLERIDAIAEDYLAEKIPLITAMSRICVQLGQWNETKKRLAKSTLPKSK